MARNSCCSRPGALASSAAAGAGASRGGAAPAARQEKKQGRSLMIKARPFSTSTSPPSTTAAAAAAAKKASPLLLPSLALPKFYSGAKLRRAKAKLLDLVSRSERGTNTGPSGPSRGEIEAAIDEVYAAAPRSALFPLESDPAGIDGKWKLVREIERERKERERDFFGCCCLLPSPERSRERKRALTFFSFFSSVVDPLSAFAGIKKTNQPGLDQREGGPVGHRQRAAALRRPGGRRGLPDALPRRREQRQRQRKRKERADVDGGASAGPRQRDRLPSGRQLRRQLRRAGPRLSERQGEGDAGQQGGL